VREIEELLKRADIGKRQGFDHLLKPKSLYSE